MKSTKIYVYPDRSYSLNPDTNPYIKDLVDALRSKNTHVVSSRTAWLGVLDIFLYISRIDAVIFNWIEEVANRKMGYLQALGLILLLPFLKLMNIKIIWTIHNKVSHSPPNLWISYYFQKKLLKQADYIVAHSKESTKLSLSSSIVYYPHPFKVDLT